MHVQGPAIGGVKHLYEAGPKQEGKVTSFALGRLPSVWQAPKPLQLEAGTFLWSLVGAVVSIHIYYYSTPYQKFASRVDYPSLPTLGTDDDLGGW
ncbi:hypothetical protein MCOR15_010790 [Pyricularia oryzae]|nr:hypothetical protein MCOR15_010790 [Pyricularia oryzae]